MANFDWTYPVVQSYTSDPFVPTCSFHLPALPSLLISSQLLTELIKTTTTHRKATFFPPITMALEDRVCDFELAKAAGLSLDRFPQTSDEAARAEDFLAKELEKLSLDEHEKVLFDIHGLTPAEEEEASIVEEKLQELERELNRIENSDKEAYNLALKLNARYVTNRAFRLMFLRCEAFSAEAAALLMVKHFDVKLKLFGDGDVLARDIRQSDLLDPLDRLGLEAGFAQVLRTRDAAGRTILMLSSDAVKHFPLEGFKPENELRVIWYLSMSMLKDEESQKNGSVWLIMNFNGFKVSMDYFHKICDMETVIPNRIRGGHYCYNDPALRPYVAGFQIFVGQHYRCRFRSHFGTRDEIDFELLTYGIPANDCPVLKDGTCSRDAHLEWLAMLRAQEEKEMMLVADEQPEVFVVVPRRFDVLFGKSSVAREHTGTLRALHIVEMYFEEYEKLGKYQKTDVAEKIIQLIHQSGGRFLKHNDQGAWVEVPFLESRQKIAHWFRHARSKKSKSLSTAESDVSSTDDATSVGDGVPSSSKRVTPIASPVDLSMLQNDGDVGGEKDYDEGFRGGASKKAFRAAEPII